MASLKDIATDLGISVQAIYKRKAADADLEAAIAAGSIKKGRRVDLNDDATAAIYKAFGKSPVSTTSNQQPLDDVISTLKEQLAVKDKQIEQLQLLLNQQQQLSLHQQLLLEAPKEKKKWFWQKQ